MNKNGFACWLAHFWQGAGSDNTLRAGRSAETLVVRWGEGPFTLLRTPSNRLTQRPSAMPKGSE